MAGLVRMSVGLAVLTLVAADRAAADEATRKKVLALNKVTGTDVLKGAMKDLLDDKAEAKNLIGEGVTLVKEKKDALTYNGALLLALASAEQKDFTSSEVFFRICMDQAAKLHSEQKLLQSYGGLIDLYYDNKKYEESAKLCRELLELKTDDGKDRIVLFAVTDRLGGTDFREDDKFDTGRNIRSGVHRLLIQAITKQGKYEQALKLVENLVKASKKNWFELQLKAWVHREANQLEESAKVYEDVIERVAKDPDLEQEEKEAYQERYKYLLSNVYVDLKQIDKASEQLEWLLQRKPDDPGFNNDLGYIWADHDMKLEEAEKLIRKAIDLDRKRRKANPKFDPEKDRDNGAYLDSLGWVLYKQKNLKEAKDVLQKAVEDKNAQHIEIYDHLGDVLVALGETEAALTAWRKGIENVGESRRDQQIKKNVQQKIEKHSGK
jgi:tetratricopeptide (TPR) repeat protein